MVTPLLVTSAIIRKDNKILLSKRAKEPFKGYWSFSGGCGCFDQVDDPKKAVILEVKADLNCKFEPEFFTYRFENLKNPAVTLFFHGDIKGEPKINPTQVSESKWFTKEGLKELKLGFCHNEILDEYLEKYPLE